MKRRLLVGIGDPEEGGLTESAAEDLEAGGKITLGEAHGNGDRGKTRGRG